MLTPTLQSLYFLHTATIVYFHFTNSLHALRVPLVLRTAGRASLALGRAGPALAAALTVLWSDTTIAAGRLSRRAAGGGGGA